MLKNNHAISLIALVFTIVVMIILTSIIAINGFNSVEKADEATIASEKKAIKEEALKAFSEYIKNSEVYPLVGQDLTGLEAGITDVTNDFNTDKEYIKLLDNRALLALGLKNVKPDHKYIVNYYNGEVYGPVVE